MPILLHGVAAATYAALAIHFWRSRWARPDPAARTSTMERCLLLFPIALHTFLLHQSLFATTDLRFGFGFALSAMLWFTVVVYWTESLTAPLAGMLAPVLAAAAVCVPLPALFPGLPASGAASGSAAFRVHTLLALGAYGLFTVAALHAMLMTLAERRLHAGGSGAALAGPMSALPPLLTLERMLFRLIAAGFVLLTLTLASGVVYSEVIFGKAMQISHKTVFAVASWIIFGALLGGRLVRGWRGRTALRWTLAGFLVLLLAYIGSRFVLEVILRRGG